MITIIDSSDLNLAKQLSRLLKITIFGECTKLNIFLMSFLFELSLPVHGREPLPTLDSSEVQEVRKELCAIRDKVNVLIDAIDRVPKTSSSSSSIAPGGGGGRGGASESRNVTQQSQPPPQTTVKGEGKCVCVCLRVCV